MSRPVSKRRERGAKGGKLVEGGADEGREERRRRGKDGEGGKWGESECASERTDGRTMYVG